MEESRAAMIPAPVVEWLETETGLIVRPDTVQPVSGGCINEARLIETTTGELVFLKLNHRHHLPRFESEIASLELLRSTKTLRTPLPLCQGVVGDQALLALEGIRLVNRSDTISQERLGKGLAQLHLNCSHDGRFGASFDNFIGATPQPNPWNHSWADFFVENRLEYQFQLAESQCLKFVDSTRLLQAVHAHLSSLNITASLLHGDLWSGNVNFDDTGRPVIYDPASYFGDAEADLAFTRLIGGFETSFYQAYRETNPEPESVRTEIYNLYHLLNHFNLFGGSYAMQAEQSIHQILSELG